MKFKLFYKYLLAGSLMTFPHGIENFHDTGLHNDAQIKTSTTIVQQKINDNAKNLCDTYIDFVLQGQTNIKSRHGGYVPRSAKNYQGRHWGGIVYMGNICN